MSDAVDLGSLTDLRDQRAAHRYLPGFGVLAGRALVYLREDSPEYGGAVYLTEVGPDGRRLRQVEQLATGDSLRTDDWPFNPPIDLYATRSTFQRRSAPKPLRPPGTTLGQTLMPDREPRATLAARSPGSGPSHVAHAVTAKVAGRRD